MRSSSYWSSQEQACVGAPRNKAIKVADGTSRLAGPVGVHPLDVLAKGTSCYAHCRECLSLRLFQKRGAPYTSLPCHTSPALRRTAMDYNMAVSAPDDHNGRQRGTFADFFFLAACHASKTAELRRPVRPSHFLNCSVSPFIGCQQSSTGCRTAACRGKTRRRSRTGP